MTFRYTPVQRFTKKLYRYFFPIPTSSYTSGDVEDMCAVNLVPPVELQHFFENALTTLRESNGTDVGDYLEFGVFNGTSVSSMYRALTNLNINNIRLFGFDAFEGLPEQSEREDGGVWKNGFYTCSFEKMNECLRSKDIDPEHITWIRGWYEDTLNFETREKYNITNPGIVFIDCDTYSSAKLVLDFIATLITSPCIICCDDWKLNNLDILEMGEYKAFNEFLDNNPKFKAKEIRSYSRKSKSFFVWT